MSTPPTLPHDVLWHIFHEIPGEKTALKQCSLVCRSWTPAATFHLFHSLTVDAFRLVHLPLSVRDDTTRIFRDFLDEAGQSPRIQSSVRKLTLRGCWRVFKAPGRPPIITDDPDGPQWPACPLGTLQDIVSTLLNLQELRIETINVTPTMEPPFPSGLGPRHRSIGSLHVPYMGGQLGNLLCCFDKIDKLIVESRTKFQDGLDEATLIESPAVPVRVLEFVGPTRMWPLDRSMGRQGFWTTVEALRAALNVSGLEKIEIDQDYYVQEEFVQFLAKCPKLKGLCVKGSTYKNFSTDLESDTACGLKLLHCPTLRSFHLLNIRLCFYSESSIHQDYSARNHWKFVCSLLAGVPSTVTNVELGMVLYSAHFSALCLRWDMSLLDWKRLDDELCRLGSRCYVRFKLTERDGFIEEFVFTMREKLSEEARKRVYVERCIESKACMTSTAELKSRSLLSMDAVYKHAGITVLRTDENSYRQELLLC